jgi:hypothetical protein
MQTPPDTQMVEGEQMNKQPRARVEAKVNKILVLLNELGRIPYYECTEEEQVAIREAITNRVDEVLAKMISPLPPFTLKD